MSENGARTLFFLVYVSFTLIIIHNQWTSGLIYRFSFFRSSLFFSIRATFVFSRFFHRIRNHTRIYIISSRSIVIFSVFTNANCYVTTVPAAPPPHHHHGHRRLLFSVCATVPKCKFSRLTWGPTCSALAAQMYCAAQLSSQQQQMYVFCQLLLFFGFSILNPFNYVEEMVVAVFIFICLFVRFVCTLVCTTFIGFLFHLASRFIIEISSSLR